MRRPLQGLGDLAGLTRGAACGLTPDLRKCCWHHLSRIIHKAHDVATTLTDLSRVGISRLPRSAATSPAPSRQGRVAHSGRREDTSHHGAPTVSAQRERPGARKGAADLGRLSEVDGVTRLHTDRSRRALQPFCGSGLAVAPSPSTEQLAFGFRIPQQ